MTHTFAENDWQSVGEGFKIELNVEVSEDKPIIQIFRVTNGIAMPDMLTFIIVTHIITITTQQPFSGYVVVK
ncbi:hypothetical protein D3C71_34320 [compost metagenome]